MLESLCSPAAWLCAHAGGLGKTTMAKLLFNTLCKQFPRAAMVELAGEQQLDQHLLQLLRGLGETSLTGLSTAQLQASLVRLMGKHKVLLLLTNVNQGDQLDSLLPPCAFSSGSRVIVTSCKHELPGDTYQVRQALHSGHRVTFDTASQAQHLSITELLCFGQQR